MTGVPFREEVEGIEKNAKIFPNLMKVTNPQIQEEQENPRKINTKKIAPRHIIIKWLKISDKKKILKAFREKGHFTH